MFPTRRGALLALLPLLSLPGIIAFATSPLLRAHPAALGAIHSAQPSVCRRLHTQRLEPLALIAGLDPGAVANIPFFSFLCRALGVPGLEAESFRVSDSLPEPACFKREAELGKRGCRGAGLTTGMA